MERRERLIDLDRQEEWGGHLSHMRPAISHLMRDRRRWGCFLISRRTRLEEAGAHSPLTDIQSLGGRSLGIYEMQKAESGGQYAHTRTAILARILSDERGKKGRASSYGMRRDGRDSCLLHWGSRVGEGRYAHFAQEGHAVAARLT